MPGPGDGHPPARPHPPSSRDQRKQGDSDMPDPTSAPSGAPPPAVRAIPAWRVLYHEQVCPQCGSADIDQEEVDTGDSITDRPDLPPVRLRLAGCLRRRVGHPPMSGVRVAALDQLQQRGMHIDYYDPD